MTEIYTVDEVARHNNAKDLWIVIHGAVYDVTAFHKEHPGGEEVLLKLAGQDATDCFETVGHSHEAISFRETYKIGELVGATSSKKKEAVYRARESMKDDWQYQEPKREAEPQYKMYLYAAIVMYAIVFYYWYSRL